MAFAPTTYPGLPAGADCEPVFASICAQAGGTVTGPLTCKAGNTTLYGSCGGPITAEQGLTPGSTALVILGAAVLLGFYFWKR